MKKIITDKSSFNVSSFLFILCIILLLLRFIVTQTIGYWFLGWNLFLAWIPYITSYIVFKFNLGKKFSLKLFLLLFSWFVFYPNSPYIFVDLRHVGYSNGMPYFIDLALTLIYAFSGAFLGFESIVLLRRQLQALFNIRLGFLILLINLIASFGVYLGLVLRFNSWDILFNPLGILASIVLLFTNSRELIEVAVFTLGYATVSQALFGFYYLLRDLK